MKSAPLRLISERLGDGLERAGMVLRVLEPGRLDASTAAALLEAWELSGGSPSGPARVLVAANRGGSFWSHVDQEGDDPVDDASRRLVMELLERHAGGWEHRLVYPGDCPVSLQAVGRAAGLGAPSWLGVSIHPDWGTWFAFRALVLTGCPLPESPPGALTDVCAVCVERQCVRSCPVEAPGLTFDLARCVDSRLGVGSACSDRCAAREACPVGANWRYPRDLLSYLYRRSLGSLAAWRRQTGPGAAG